MSDAPPPAAPQVPGWRHVASGKVRDLYVPDAPPAGSLAVEPADAVVLLVASDRISAYDYVLPTPIPDKGAILTALSVWWFEQLADVVPNHLVSLDVPGAVAGRAMICRRLDMYPVECVARGYLAGSGLAEYRETGAVCGVELPPGLVEGSKLPRPIFTPATKADLGEHDENVTFEKAAAEVGEDVATRLRDLTLELYTRASQIAAGRGIILADTKFEFGRRPGTDEIVLGDEVLTPDSSRYWPAETWQPGRPQPSFDKQYVRDWLASPASGWDRTGGALPPELPADVVEKTRARYVEAYERLTGRAF
ncbi:phosphoribosylaminoimidazole-succinocarboxamides ynthase [Beutenbergia cavernae DSM 12333]|uniref:Phosphoribosylaminoimidazole-succinocarboxamide synthase n=1 Tax=Beutenbergia cavernae (strain ATCC BAA-8 / DSM 12333 / CCUG 43141 / JCM 11478 / NBRC 16432 / NCIMB 13614 / HKI 0122) TaxID=471853 RepID=C5C2Z2_BEUC1|nr:phosphoribosylaminoimidazolesuccinocarboxamide synthase [Beutenbergia cavernae]ACQ81836.1 phosphoribosylaminoimidazole-succinocarboxamides ynthase [Beutenbergia cavernae DSM 12333]